MRRFAENLPDRPPVGEEIVTPPEPPNVAPVGSRAEFAQMLNTVRKEQR
jgi:hypothetical protein